MRCSAAGDAPPSEVTADELAQLEAELAALQQRRERITQENRQLRRDLRRAADEVPRPAPLRFAVSRAKANRHLNSLLPFDRSLGSRAV